MSAAGEVTGAGPQAESSTPERLLGPSYGALTIGTLTLVLMVAFEAMAVGTAMPVAARELNGLSLYAWGFSGFLAASMFGTVVAGDLADRLGPFRPLLAGVGLFSLGLAVAGTATTMPVFVIGRAAQGLGGGALVVTLSVIAGRAYPKRLLPRLMAALSSVWVLPAIVGPLISGLVTERLTWRLVFLGLLPLAILPLALIAPRLRRLPDVDPPEARTGRKRLALATAAGVALLQYAGEELQWWSLLLLGVGAALLIPALPRLFPAGTLRLARGIPSIVAMRGILAGSFMGMQAFMPLMLKEHRGLSVTMAGLILTVGSLGWSLGSFWQGRANLRADRARIITMGGACVTAGIVLNLLVVATFVPVWLAALGAVTAGFGMGLCMSSLSVLLLSESPDAEKGANSAAMQLCESLGQVTLVGSAGVLFATLHTSLAGGWVFVPIFGVMAIVGLAGTVVSGRVAIPR